MTPLRLACGAGFYYRDPDLALSPHYPDREMILHHAAWAAKERFEGIELSSTTFEHFKRTYDEILVEEINQTLARESLLISQFNVNFLVSLASLNPRREAAERLDALFERAAEMSCKVISTPASFISETVTSHGYLYPWGPPSRIRISDSFSWASSWENYVEAISFILDRAANFGMKVALEPRPREMISSTDSLLALFREVASSDLGALVDTGYVFAQREYIPLSLRKLDGKIFGVHLSDSDGFLEHHWAPGEGKIDWSEIIPFFHSVNYNGLHTLAVGIIGNPEFDFRQGKSFLDRLSLSLR